jgi:hypothetical protein
MRLITLSPLDIDCDFGCQDGRNSTLGLVGKTRPQITADYTDYADPPSADILKKNLPGRKHV